MSPEDFRRIRDIPGKVIDGDITLVQRPKNRVFYSAEGVPIHNCGDKLLVLAIAYQPESRYIKFNVSVVPGHAICRLCINGPEHRDAGRTHKHSVKSEASYRRNLEEDADPMPHLTRLPLVQAFAEFCRMGNIEHRGRLRAPDLERLGEII